MSGVLLRAEGVVSNGSTEILLATHPSTGLRNSLIGSYHGSLADGGVFTFVCGGGMSSSSSHVVTVLERCSSMM